MRVQLCSDKQAEKFSKTKKALFAVTWQGGGDGCIDICDLKEIKSWDWDSEGFEVMDSLIEDLKALGFGETRVFNDCTQSIAFMRISDWGPVSDE